MNRRTGLLFVTPALALFGVFVLYPMVTSFSYAFYGWAGTARQGFVGLENFTALFTRAPFTTDLPRALWHKVLFFVGTMLVQNTIGLTVAFLLHRRARTRRARRGDLAPRRVARERRQDRLNPLRSKDYDSQQV